MCVRCTPRLSVGGGLGATILLRVRSRGRVLWWLGAGRGRQGRMDARMFWPCNIVGAGEGMVGVMLRPGLVLVL